MRYVGSYMIFLIVALAVSCSETPVVSERTTPDSPSLDRDSPGVAVYHWTLPCTDCDNLDFDQVLLSGTLRVNRTNEYPPRVYTASITPTELEAVLALLRDARLATYLESGCGDPQPNNGGINLLVKTGQLAGEQPALCADVGKEIAQLLADLHQTYFPDVERVWVAGEPIQCLSNVWEQDWIEKHGGDASLYPTDIAEQNKIIDAFFTQQGADVSSIARRQLDGAVCLACSCPAGYTLYLEIPEDAVELMSQYGFRLEAPPAE